MQVAKVIGNIWATRKEEKLAGLKLLLVQPINPLNGELYRIPIVAADIIGAGVGETVVVVGGSSARSAAGTGRKGQSGYACGGSLSRGDGGMQGRRGAGGCRSRLWDGIHTQGG